MTHADPEPSGRALERMNRFQEPEAHAIIADLGLPEGSRGLDVGCGVGLYALWLAEAVGPRGHVLGVEPSEERVAEARALVGGRLPPSRLEFREGDALSTPTEPGTLDFVFTRYLLVHLPEPGQVIRNMFRSARKGGIVMAVEPDFSFQACYPSSWAYERIPRLLEALLPDPFIGRKLVHLFRRPRILRKRVSNCPWLASR